MIRFDKCWIVLKDSSKTDIKTKLIKSLILCLGCNICRAALRYNLSCWFEMQTKVSQLICPILKIPNTQTIQTNPNMMHCIVWAWGFGGGNCLMKFSPFVQNKKKWILFIARYQSGISLIKILTWITYIQTKFYLEFLFSQEH